MDEKSKVCIHVYAHRGTNLAGGGLVIVVSRQISS